MAELRINGIRKRFGALEVLHGIDLAAEDGEFLVLVGPSGCGKSTLLSIIAGLEAASEGTIEIDGEIVNDLEPKERNIAMVFQSYALYPSMTVEQNMAFPLEMSGVGSAERRKRVGEVAELLKIGALLRRRPSQLSGGQRQRVAMGRALVREPKLFLFDEPLSNLDAQLRVEMRTEIKKLHHRLGTTIVYVTHDQIEAMTMATRIAVMKDGALQQLGTPQEIYGRPANVFVATFMGSPPMNLIPATVDADGRRLLLSDGGRDLPLPSAYGGLVAPGRPLLIGIRPEHFVHRSGDGDMLPAVELQIDLVEPTGPEAFVAARLGTRDIVARVPADSPLHPGETKAFSVDIAKTVLFDAASGAALEQLPSTQ